MKRGGWLPRLRARVIFGIIGRIDLCYVDAPE